ncbi:MAG: hypothetical protein CVV64_06825 [Candidatus Wallbacteria bacterium HGW-Wallbacteria-1]|uniref:Uncharacterized protein n=1 Tax=Candidatus Wallbacteria bacterium HGW-Wallbacteria-1 TaxID=2013854 RepID=A0A2N1PT64_9BACT|nr:MAG: hypothetical protein CVV64_06825 [Candidatus Wallbacteria bacterium HGW-Wallbacteria-1]
MLRKKRAVLSLIVALAMVFGISGASLAEKGWTVSPGSVTTGFNLSTGDMLKNLKSPELNINIVSYNQGAKYTVDEGNIAKTAGKIGDSTEYNATVDRFTGLRVNGFAGLGADLSWKPMSLEEKMLAAEEKGSTDAQGIAGVAKRDGFKAATLDGKQIDNTIIMREGTEKFGWGHISYDRPDGTNHARELKSVYGLTSDDQVKDLIMHAIQTGDVQEQVRDVNGQEQKRYIFTKEIDGRPMKVVVDQGQHEGSVITAYPTKYKRDRKTAAENVDIPRRYENPKKGSLESFIGAQAGGDLFIGSEITGSAGISHTDKRGIKYSGSVGGAAQVGAMAKGKVYAGLRNGKDVVVGARGDAFAGARLSGAASTGVEYKGVGARVTGSGHIGYGIGATGKAEAKISFDGIKFDLDGQLYLGVGGGLGLSGEIKFGKAGEIAKKGFDKGVEVTKKVVDKTRNMAKSVADTTRVVTRKAVDTTKAVAKSVADTTRDVKKKVETKVVDTARKIGSATSSAVTAARDKAAEVGEKAKGAAKSIGKTVLGWFS